MFIHICFAAVAVAMNRLILALLLIGEGQCPHGKYFLVRVMLFAFVAF